MKWVIEERMKHRLTGLVVIISMAVIFLPAILKKSNHRLDENIRVSLKLPAKPTMPQVAIPNQDVMFESLKVARVNIPVAPVVAHKTKIAKAEPLVATQVPVNLPPSTVAIPRDSAKIVPVMTKALVTAKTTAKSVTQSVVAVKKPSFSVQVASFSKQENAKKLVNHLRQQGFVASYLTLHGRRGDSYQVIVGHTAYMDLAQSIKRKLATNLHLNGFVVKTTVG